jgi:hypothetical protein
MSFGLQVYNTGLGKLWREKKSAGSRLALVSSPAVAHRYDLEQTALSRNAVVDGKPHE